jgi:hypothetical protein
MLKKEIEIKTFLTISVWRSFIEDVDPWCYSVKLGDYVTLCSGNNFATEKAAYQAALKQAVSYKSQLEW